MKKYRLVSVIDVPIRRLIRNRMQTIKPGIEYEDTDEVVDELLKLHEKLRSTEKLKSVLEDAGIEYKEVVCKQCGGRVIKLEFCPIEEVL